MFKHNKLVVAMYICIFFFSNQDNHQIASQQTGMEKMHTEHLALKKQWTYKLLPVMCVFNK